MPELILVSHQLHGLRREPPFSILVWSSVMISDAEIAECVRERIAAALPNHVVRSIARQIIRKELGVMTLLETAKFLKWRDPEALRKKLRRAGVLGIKTSSRILTYAIPDLVAFRERNRQPKASQRSASRGLRSVKMEGSNAA
jgi:hypothetical protein